MSSLLKLRRGSTISHAGFTGADGEVTFNTDTNALVTHDGATAGGFPHVKASDLAASSGSSLVGYLPAGAGAVATTVQSKLRESASIFDFMSAEQIADVKSGAATIDIAPAVLAAIAEFPSSVELRFPAGTYLWGSALVLLAFNSSIKIVGDGTGATVIKKNFSGDLFTINSAANFELSRITLDGQYGTHTGRCVVLTGASHFPTFENLITAGFSENHIDFAANSGFGANVFNHQAILGAGQPSCVGVSLSGRDTGYTVRRIINCNYAGPIDLSAGCDNVFITASQFTKVITSALCSNLFIQSCRWGNAGGNISIYGSTIVTGCSFSGSVMLDTSFDGSFIGNKQTGGALPYLTNNSIGCQLFHFDPSGLFHVNKAKLEYPKVGEIEICNSNSIGDVNYTYVFGASPAIVVFTAPLTASRVITLPTIGGRAGIRVRFVRSAGDTGGPWHFSVGSTGKTLSANSWCDVLFNGSYWVITGAGSL